MFELTSSMSTRTLLRHHSSFCSTDYKSVKTLKSIDNHSFDKKKFLVNSRFFNAFLISHFNRLVFEIEHTLSKHAIENIV